MLTFEEALAFVLHWEGGYSHNPQDHGGATNYGITQATYDLYRHKYGKPIQSVQDILYAEVSDIYRKQYWDVFNSWGLDDPLHVAAFNDAVNAGVGACGKLLLACHKDVATFLDLQEAFYHRIVAHDASQGKFLQGWLNRLNAMRKLVEDTKNGKANP